MARNDTTSAIIDGVLRLSVTSGAIAVGLLIPNMMIAFEKPLDIFWKQLDKRERERELRRIISYMKSNQLVTENYQHGLQITKKGRERLAKLDFDSLKIKRQKKWDHKWRIVIYDIPEKQRAARIALTNKLNDLNFYQLQRSAWLHPFPCRDIVESITSRYGVDRYVSYIRATDIDKQQILVQRFKKKYPATNFK